jgi:hypothetical protein
MLAEPKSLNDPDPGLMHDKMAGELCGFARNSRPQCLDSVQVVQKVLIRFAADLEKYILPYVSRGPVTTLQKNEIARV